MTLCILARNPYTGALGFGIASGSDDCVGGSISADEDSGIISLQGRGDHDLRQKIFALLKSGVSSPEIIRYLREHDSYLAHRQVLILPRRGESGIWTGQDCLKWAGHLARDHFMIGGNMLCGPDVIEKMKDAYQADMHAHLHRRLFFALRAGVASGGDLRGHRSCGVVVYGPNAFDCRIGASKTAIFELENQIKP